MPRAAALLCAALVLSACGGPAPPPFKSIADVKVLMTAVVDPAADVVWQSVATIVGKDGVEERRPRTDDEWAAVRAGAVLLAESGNLLMMPPRAKDGGEWMARAQALVDEAAIAVRAAEAKDAKALLVAGGPIDEACERCHKKYMPNY